MSNIVTIFPIMMHIHCINKILLSALISYNSQCTFIYKQMLNVLYHIAEQKMCSIPNYIIILNKKNKFFEI